MNKSIAYSFKIKGHGIHKGMHKGYDPILYAELNDGTNTKSYYNESLDFVTEEISKEEYVSALSISILK